MNTSIVAGGTSIDIGCRVVLWNEEKGFSFYLYNKFYPSNLELDGLKNNLKSFTLHHSVTWTAKQTYSGLIGRGLSVNFILDDDVNEDGCATLYQCLDIKDVAWSQGIDNRSGPGIEISLQPAAWQDPNFYSEINQKKFGVSPHNIQEDTVDGRTYKCFGPTEAQHQTLIKLLEAYCQTFYIPGNFPRDEKGEFIKTVISDPVNYRGILNHYNIDPQKIDCLGLDLGRIESGICPL